MSKEALKTPVLLIIFNRPDTTQKVFEQIRKAKPKRLFIAADGPRPDNNLDKEKCCETRSIISQIDWPCEIKTLFRDQNLGCGLAPSSAISWFFDHVEEGIILEDDCVPSQSFFYFCQELLKFYRNDSRVFHIGGTSYRNLLDQALEDSYYFIRIPRIWGWATWRRAWAKYDFEMGSFPKFKRNNHVKDLLLKQFEEESILSALQDIYNKVTRSTKPSAWDLQWTYTIITNNGLSITSTKNLIENIGFGEDATHTKCGNPIIINNFAQEIDIKNIKHPPIIIPNKTDEKYFFKNIYGIKEPSKTKQFLKKTFPKLVNLYRGGKRIISRKSK